MDRRNPEPETPRRAERAAVAAGDEPLAPTGAEPARREPLRRSSHLGSAGWIALSAVLALLLWLVGTAVLGPGVLPDPLAVLSAIGEAYREGDLVSDMTITFGRVVGAFAITMIVGVAVGVLLGRVRWFQGVFLPWQRVLASVPALLVAVVIYLILGLNNLAAMVATALIVLPNIVYTSWEGVKALDPQLQEMARAFGFNGRQTLRHVVLPQLATYIFAAAHLGLALTWKLMVFVELLGQSSGVGYRINFWYQVFNMERVLASALPFIVVMLAIDSLLLGRLERRTFGWRRKELT